MAKLFADTHYNGFSFRVGKKTMSVQEVKESGLVLTQANLDELRLQGKACHNAYGTEWDGLIKSYTLFLDAIAEKCLKPKRVTKWINEYVIQENCGYGWDDATSEETMKEAKAQLKCYRENVPHEVRLITRRVPNPAYTA